MEKEPLAPQIYLALKRPNQAQKKIIKVSARGASFLPPKPKDIRVVTTNPNWGYATKRLVGGRLGASLLPKLAPTLWASLYLGARAQ